MPKRTIQTTYELDAPILRVWDVLTRIDDYERWNPFVVRAKSTPAATTVGAILRFTVRWHDGGGATSQEEVVEMQPPSMQGERSEANWVYCYRGWMRTIGMIRTVRTQRLTQERMGPTIYRSELCLSGWGVALAPVSKIERGMVAQAESLRSVVEGVGD